MTGVTTGAGHAYPSVAPAFITVFCGVHFAQSLVFCIVFYRSLSAFLTFFLFAIVESVLFRFTTSVFPV
jgi:hypothetical protein